MRIKLDKPVQIVRLSDELLAAIGAGHSIARIDGALTLVLADGQNVTTAQQVIDAHDATPPTVHVRAVKHFKATEDVAAVVARAAALVVRDEINILRKWTRDFKAEVAAATNLANLQTRVANNMPTLGDRSIQQAKDAIENKINSNEAD